MSLRLEDMLELRTRLRLELAKALSPMIADASNGGVIESAIEDLEKIERYIIGETE